MTQVKSRTEDRARRAKKRQKRVLLVILSAFLCGAVAGAALFGLIGLIEGAVKGASAGRLANVAVVENDDSAVNFVPPAEPIHSRQAYLVSARGQVLLDDGGGTTLYPASMTKIMTAIVAIERAGDLDAVVPLRGDAFEALWAANAATAGFLPDEEAPVLSLLHGLLLGSGAECGVGLAEYISGSEGAFVELMNQKAAELGMTGTHFVNTSGLHDANHYSTPRDIGVLLAYALENDVFYSIVTAARYTTPATNFRTEGLEIENALLARVGPGEPIKGGKTGYTPEAGQCLASFAEIGGERYILVTGGAPGEQGVQNLHIEDAVTLYACIETK